MPAPSILVVEDEAVILLDIQHALRQRGYRISGTACSGEDAVRLARQALPDVVLMDVRLRGDMDGIEAACRIQKERAVPIIFLTAFSDGPTLQRAKSAEPFAYLLKPFEESLLAANIEIALHAFQTGQSVARHQQDLAMINQRCFDELAHHALEHAVALLDSAGIIRSWNPAAEAIYGWTAAEILGQPSSVLHGGNDQGLERHLEKAARTGTNSIYETEARKDGSLFPAKLTLVGLSNSTGQLAGFLKVSQEVMPGKKEN